MSRFYLRRQDCDIVITFLSADGCIIEGFSLPLDVLHTPNTTTGIAYLEKDLMAHSVDGTVRMVIRTNNFFVPGIGTERSFLLALKRDYNKNIDLPVIPLPKLSPFLLAMRKHGRVLTTERIDLESFRRNQAWSQRSFRYLFSSVGSDLPLIDDPSQIPYADGFYRSECGRTSSHSSGSDSEGSLVEMSFLFPPANLYNEKDCKGLGDIQFLRDGKMSSEEITSLVVYKYEIPTELFSLTMSEEDAAALKERVKADFPVPDRAPLEVFLYIDKLTSYSITVNGQLTMCPKFAVIVTRWTGASLDVICRKWFTKTLNAGVEVENIPKVVISRFASLSEPLKVLILQLDHLANPSTAEYDAVTKEPIGCSYCKLADVHTSIRCPIFDEIADRDFIIRSETKCVGCHDGNCDKGRAQHFDGFRCLNCNAGTHLQLACDNRASWELYVRQAQYIMAATSLLSENQLKVLHRDLPHARRIFLDSQM